MAALGRLTHTSVSCCHRVVGEIAEDEAGVRRYTVTEFPGVFQLPASEKRIGTFFGFRYKELKPYNKKLKLHRVVEKGMFASPEAAHQALNEARELREEQFLERSRSMRGIPKGSRAALRSKDPNAAPQPEQTRKSDRLRPREEASEAGAPHHETQPKKRRPCPWLGTDATEEERRKAAEWRLAHMQRLKDAVLTDTRYKLIIAHSTAQGGSGESQPAADAEAGGEVRFALHPALSPSAQAKERRSQETRSEAAESATPHRELTLELEPSDFTKHQLQRVDNQTDLLYTLLNIFHTNGEAEQPKTQEECAKEALQGKIYAGLYSPHTALNW